MSKKPILEIDARGWSKLQGNLPRYRLFLELYQNSKDEVGTSKIEIEIKPQPGRPLAEFSVTDNGPGFSDLAHAYTLFAPSNKLGNPDQSGFMNMGEKAVVVGCDRLTVTTTTGTVEFDMREQSREEFPRRKRERGTVVSGVMRMTREELDETVKVLKTLIVPDGVVLLVNGEEIPHRRAVRTFKAKLPTRLLEDGELVTRTRETEVKVYEVRPGETPTLYEMGIPVVDHDIKEFHVSVNQKVILNKDRDNVTPAYMQAVRVFTLNNTADLLSTDNASEDWVREAAGDERAEADTVERVMDLRFGEKRVQFSPLDPEANNKAVANGFTLIHGRTLSEGERANANKFNLLPVSHHLFPTAKPYSDDPNAPPVVVLDESEYTEGMKNVVAYAKFLGRELLGRNVPVRIVRAPNFGACYGPTASLDFSVTRLGRAWFDRVGEHTDDLLLHEYGHHYEMNHLSEGYYKALTKLGAKLKRLALTKPEAFTEFLG